MNLDKWYHRECAMGKSRVAGATAASPHSVLRAHLTWELMGGTRGPRNSILQACQRLRYIHHSAELRGFYSNRLYKKQCARCGRPNIVPVSRCGYCDEALTDDNIRPVGRDVLKELAASRTYHHSRINPSSEGANIPTSTTARLSSERGHTIKLHYERHLPCSREARAPIKEDADSLLLNASLEKHHFEETSKAGCITRLSPSFLRKKHPTIIEYYRSFDFLIMQYPFPIAAVHLSAVVKGTVYDAKQLRPSHVPLLQRMQRYAAAVIEDILQTNVCFQGEVVLGDPARGVAVNAALGPSNTRRGRSQFWRDNLTGKSACYINNAREKQRADMKTAVQRLKSCVIFGFTYPCEYNQVNMHAIVPPIFNFNMMKAPFFIPLKKVLHDLQHSGYVQVNERDAGKTGFGRDAILEEAQWVDASVRRLFGLKSVSNSEEA